MRPLLRRTVHSRKAAALAIFSLMLLSACCEDVLGKKARGNWQGEAEQINLNGIKTKYSVTVAITDAEHIVVDYPSLKCDTWLERLPSSDGYAEYREHVDSNEGGNCAEGGLVSFVLSESDNSKLSYRWKYHVNDNDLIYATATLNRVPPAEAQDLDYFRNQANDKK